MKGALALRNPVGKVGSLDTGSTSVTSGAYVELQSAANMTSPCSAIIVSNGGAQPLTLATGAAGSEVDLGVVIPPTSGLCVIIPCNLKKSTRMSLKSLGGTQSSGVVTIGYLG